MNTVPKDVDAYIVGMPKEARGILVKLRREIKKAAPKALERISYGMPFYEYGGSGFKGRLIYFAVSKKHIAVYIPPSRAGGSSDKLKKYQATKSAFHFPLDKPFPFALVGKVVQEIVKKIDNATKSKSIGISQQRRIRNGNCRGLYGSNGNCRGPVALETGAIPPLSRLGRGILTPPRRRAFWPGGGPS